MPDSRKRANKSRPKVPAQKAFSLSVSPSTCASIRDGRAFSCLRLVLIRLRKETAKYAERDTVRGRCDTASALSEKTNQQTKPFVASAADCSCPSNPCPSAARTSSTLPDHQQDTRTNVQPPTTEYAPRPKAANVPHERTSACGTRGEGTAALLRVVTSTAPASPPFPACFPSQLFAPRILTAASFYSAVDAFVLEGRVLSSTALLLARPALLRDRRCSFRRLWLGAGFVSATVVATRIAAPQSSPERVREALLEYLRPSNLATRPLLLDEALVAWKRATATARLATWRQRIWKYMSISCFVSSAVAN